MKFIYFSDNQYFISTDNDEELGHLVRDDKKVWGYYISRRNVLFLESELEIILAKLKELNKQ